MLNLSRKTAARDGARLHDMLVSRARDPVFFTVFAVADTIDGRFDMLVFHAWLALAELREAGRPGAAQALTDALFTGFDESLREQGAGDMGISRKLKIFADAFYGRLAAYDGAPDAAALAAALARNLYRGGAVDARPLALARYAATARQSLKSSLPAELDFGPLPTL